MRTITKTHDYYDSLMRSDLDKQIVFMRDSSYIKKDDLKLNNRTHWNSSPEDYKTFGHRYNWRYNKDTRTEGNSFIIGFCGKIYNGIRITTNPDCYPSNIPSIVTHAYEDEMYDLIKENENKSAEYRAFYKSTKRDINTFKAIKNSKYLKDIFMKYKVPYFVIEHDKPEVTLLPTLKDYQFYKMFGSYGAYQEIRMFVENQLSQDTKVVVPVGDDKVLAQSKGFNKYSFRKDKQKK